MADRSNAPDHWDARQYLRYADERARPFVDLLGRVDAGDPAAVVDLGCGAGNLTAMLAERWPGATVTGVDSSRDMLDRAASHAVAGRLRFVHDDVRDWAPDGPVDVVVSNATLQWVPGHVGFFERWVGWLRPGGCFAFQVPGNFRAPSHTLLADLRLSARWRDKLGEGAERHLAVSGCIDYVEALVALGCAVDTWETTYLHVLHGPDPVLEWVKGTGLRPVLAALTSAEADEFCAELGERLRTAYPARPWGTPFPFRRVFVVARRA